MIAPGRWADIVLVEDLENFHAELVIVRGQVAVENGSLLIDLPSGISGLGHAFGPSDTALVKAKISASRSARPLRRPRPRWAQGEVHVIGVIENQAPTRHLRLEVAADGWRGPCRYAAEIWPKLAMVERHQNSGTVQLGLVQGFGFNLPCAVASTVAHDCHQMIVVGTDEEDMALAVNDLAEVGGGQVVVRNGQVIGLVELPIGGLMSNETGRNGRWKGATRPGRFPACGCKLNNPNMQLSLLALVVIPELRISDIGPGRRTTVRLSSGVLKESRHQ